MSELIHRAQDVQRVVSDESLTKYERLSQGLESFSEMEIPELDEVVWEPLEVALVEIDALLASHDHQRGLEILQAAVDSAIEAVLDRIVGELDEGVSKLPVEAIHEAREHRELMIPRLIRVLREATDAARAGDIPNGNAHFFALFLLTEFEAAEAFPAIIEAMSLPGELPFDLFGDAVTNNLSGILAQFAGDTPELLDTLIANGELNYYVRWEAAHVYIHLVRDERLPKNVAVQRLQHHLRRAINDEDVQIVSALVTVLADLSPIEAIEDIREAFDRDLIEPNMVSREEIEESIASGDRAVHRFLDRCPPTGIADTIEELQRWAAFQEQPARPPIPQKVPRPHSLPTLRDIERVVAPAIAKRPHIGRNAPCPCGSGKKFKKCCGARQ